MNDKELLFYEQISGYDITCLFAAWETGPAIKFYLGSKEWVESHWDYTNIQICGPYESLYSITPEEAKAIYGDIEPDVSLLYEQERFYALILKMASLRLQDKAKEKNYSFV